MCHLCACRKKSSEHELRELLREKEEQVTGLMEEGKTQWYPCNGLGRFHRKDLLCFNDFLTLVRTLTINL